MKYFAYGSNMSLARLQARIPGAKAIGRFCLAEHDLRFHKAGRDGSGKCDAFFTGDKMHAVYGVLYSISLSEKRILDRYEGLGSGYRDKQVVVCDLLMKEEVAITYCATDIDSGLKPFSWYKRHVVIGASEGGLPAEYVSRIEAVEALRDPLYAREVEQLMIHQE